MRKLRVVLKRKKAAGRCPAAIRNGEAITNPGALHSDISKVFAAYGAAASGLSAEEAGRDSTSTDPTPLSMRRPPTGGPMLRVRSATLSFCYCWPWRRSPRSRRTSKRR